MSPTLAPPDDLARALLWRHVEGNLQPGEDELLAQLLREHPHYAEALFTMADERLTLALALRGSTQAGHETVAAPNAARSARRKRTHTARFAVRPQSRPFPRMVLLAASFLLMVGAGVWFFQTQVAPPGPILARIVSVNRETAGAQASVVHPRGSLMEALSADLALRRDDRLEVPAGVYVAMRSEDRTVDVDIEPNSTLTFAGRDDGNRLSLERGGITVNAAPQPAGRPLRVVTPRAEAVVRGTTFTLSVALQTTRLDVTKGAVSFIRRTDGATVEVGAGHYAIAAPGVELAVLAIADQPLAAKPETPVVKPEAPVAKPETPVAKPETPVAKPETPALTGWVFLSALDEQEVQVGYGEFGKNGDLGYPPGRIIYQGQEVPHGISLHPPKDGSSHVAYLLEKRFTTFQTGTGIDDNSFGLGSPVTFKVIGDGRLLWKSTPFRKGVPPQQCHVEVAGVEKLELEVDCPGFNHGCNAIWLEPQVLAK